ncbi:MAG TPA: DUF1707 domain-containing protein [Nocardioidaceae bacterium]|nr:DUF1707 domain-containing protein [Nocardioidaceae bacterium]
MRIESELRIGDTEREAAVASLGEHFAAGRLSRAEYDERTDLAFHARTGSQLSALFRDLPPEPPTPPPPPPAGPRGWAVRAASLPMLPLVFLAIGIAALSHGVFWPLIVAACLFCLAGRRRIRHSHGRGPVSRGRW